MSTSHPHRLTRRHGLRFRQVPTFVCVLGLALIGACEVSAHDKEAAQIHFDLGVNAMEVAHDPQSALKEFQIALKANPDMADVEDGLGLVYHVMLHKPEVAVEHYRRALKLNPKFTEAANNLGGVLTELGRYAEAAEQFKRVLADELYRTPYIAEGNLGWALYKEGAVVDGIQHLKTSLALNPGYCQGYRSLGMIYVENGRLEDAETQFGHFHEKCPDLPEASYRLGLLFLKEGKQERAKEQLQACAEAKAAKDTDLGAECARMLKLMQ
jgi:Tfp pilus assembly protein PilF